MTDDRVVPVERPDGDTKTLMNEQFEKWLEQRRAELEKVGPIGELVPRVARILALGHRAITRKRPTTRQARGATVALQRLILARLHGFSTTSSMLGGVGLVNSDREVVSWALIGLVVLGVLLFWPAGTFSYWQAWVLICVFMLATIVPSVYLGRTDPAALQRRLHAGPLAETRAVQKVIIVGAFLGLLTMIGLSAFDHRLGWSSIPASLCTIGDVLVAAGLLIGTVALTQNSYAATVTVEPQQKLASGGLYKLVRHPMYSGSLVLLVGTPLALGSYWGLLLTVPGLLGLVFRILDEERMLSQELVGYRAYMQRVHFRLVPYLW